MAGQYDRVLNLLKKWPLDTSKGARDFGFHLRERAKHSFPFGFLFGQEEAERKLDSLYRLADNKYGQKYPLQKKSSASGLNVEQCRRVLSRDFIEKYSK